MSMIGKKILHYRVLSPLGVGGMAKVFLGEDEKLGRKVAIKMLDPTLLDTPELVERFKKEARFQAGLSHPNIVSVHDYHAEDDLFCIVMDYVEGNPLSRIIKKGALSAADCVSIMTQTLDGVGYAHERGIVHRDLKPSNVMVQRSGSRPIARVMDFGIAKLENAGPGLTQDDDLLGSLHYMSPEQIRSTMSVDHLTDIYSLGVALYEMATGKKPFDHKSEARVLTMIQKGKAAPPQNLNPDVTPRLADAIIKAMDVDPAKRFASCAEFYDAICEAPPAKPTETPAPAPEQTPPPKKSRRGIFILLTIILAAAVAAIVAYLWLFQ